MIHYAYQLCSAMAKQEVEVTLVTAQEYELEHLPHNFSVIKLLDLWSRKGKSGSTNSSTATRFLSKLSRFIRRLFRGYKFIAAWFVLVNFLVKEKPDIVQFGSMEFPFETLFLQYMRRKGLVLTQICHEFEHRDRKIPSKLLQHLDWRGQAKIFRNFDAIFFHAQNNLQRFKSLYPDTTENLFVIPMGNEALFTSQDDDDEAVLALAKKYKVAPQGPNVLFFGTINPSKGLDDLIRAFAKVRTSRPDARLIIAGNPSKYVEMHHYLGLIREHDLEEAVVTDIRYIPNDDIAPLMQLSKVVVYPYHNSTQSASLQVAYSFGKPVIATNVGGLPEVVVDQKSGLLIPPKDIEALAAAIIKILNDPEFAEQMGEFAKNLSETEFSWGPIAQKILGVYQNLLRSRENKWA